MEKAIEQIIREFHETQLPFIVRRDLSIPFNLKKVFVIYGLRRAGKTYYLYQLIQQFLEQGYSQKEVFYINFEDERLEGIKAKDLSKIVELYYKFNPKTKIPLFFFDEIQEVEGWEKFARRLFEKTRAKIFLTGSSSKLLSQEIATTLRGRTLSYQLFPYSFKEFLRARHIIVRKVLTEKEAGKIKKALEEYILYGGYPEIVDFPIREKLKTLKEYLDLIIYRDLVERFDIKKLSNLKLLLHGLIESFAKEFSLRKYYNFLKSQGRRVGKNTLYFYFDALQEINFFFVIKKYARTLRAIEGSMPKVYLTDVGPLALFGKEDFGRRIENLVAIELLREKEYKDILIESFYYKSPERKEVDFIIKKRRKVKELIQVCYEIDNYNVKEREINSLLKAAKDLKCNRLLVITMDFEGEETIKTKKIAFIPLWKWLLK